MAGVKLREILVLRSIKSKCSQTVGDVLGAIVSCFSSLFADRKAATLLAQEVVSALEKVDVASAGVDPILKGKVAALAGKIQLLAVGIKVIDVSSDLMDYIADNWTNHRTGDYTGMSASLSLRALKQPTLGVVHDLYKAGYGEVRPSNIYGAGVPYLIEVFGVSWRSWGEAQAVGDATARYVTQNPNGPYPIEPTVFVAFDLGDCRGHFAYRAMEWYFPQHGESFNPNNYYDICAGARIINGQRFPDQ